MKSTSDKKNEINRIDELFIKAIDLVIKDSKEAGIKPDSSAGISKIIYPTSKGIISRVRTRQNHIPHNALISFAKYYNVDMNYFYHDGVKFKYDLNKFLPAHKQMKNIEPAKQKLKIKNINFGEIKIEDEISFEDEELAKIFKLDALIRTFSKMLPEYASQFFYNILHIIKFDYESKIIDLKENINLLEENSKQMNKELINSKNNENLALKKLIKKIEFEKI